MSRWTLIVALIFVPARLAVAADENVIESAQASQDIAPSTDPAISFWQGTPPVFADKTPFGQTLPRYRTEIRSRWTKKNLYFLFICPYEKLYLKPSPATATETSRAHRHGLEDLVRSHEHTLLRPTNPTSDRGRRVSNQSVSQPRPAPESDRRGLATHDEQYVSRPGEIWPATAHRDHCQIARTGKGSVAVRYSHWSISPLDAAAGRLGFEPA